MSPLRHGNTVLPLERGKTLFDYADDLSVRVPTSCGRTGECHECVVEVKRGSDALLPPTSAEGFLRGDYRLACQAAIVDTDADVEFNVLRRQPRILTESMDREIDRDPIVMRRGDDVVRTGPGAPVSLGTYRGAIYGIAADIGTTTVAMNLVDMESGDTVYVASFENPQRFGGSDVMHRISYETGEYRGELQAVLVSSINYEIGEMVRELKIRRRQICDFVAVGNATMRDMLFGIDVEPIGVKPYKSRVELEFIEGKRDSTALNTSANELGIRIHPDANIYGGPIISSHVGADVAADLLAIGMAESDELQMLVDIGTNTEIVAGNRDSLIAASCPAGPAFEGGGVTYAMPGYDGAVERLRIPGDVTAPELEVIGNIAPSGICGSGLIDLLAELRRHGIMSELGAFDGKTKEFVFAPDERLTLSRADISALAQAKAANYCGQQIVLQNAGKSALDYSELHLAGGFANYIDPENAKAIGFLPDIPADRIVKVGNASLLGATIMLLDAGKRSEAESFSERVQHIELETDPDFFEYFVEGCQFKPMPID